MTLREEGVVRSWGRVAMAAALVVLAGDRVEITGGLRAQLAPRADVEPLTREAPDAVRFVRGDANSDGHLTLSDVFAILRNNFTGDKVGCQDAADVDDNGTLDQSDALYLVGAVFFRQNLISEPFVEPGIDPTPDGLDCRRGITRKGRGAGGVFPCEDPGAIADLEFIHFRRDVEVLAGQQHVRVPVVMNSPVGDVEGFTLSLRAPTGAVRMEGIDIEDGIYDWFGVRPEWVIPYDGQREDGFLALTVAMSLSPPFALLPEFHGGVVAHLQFSVSPDLTPGTRFRIDFADIPAARGSPPIRNELSRNGARHVFGVCSLGVSVVSEEELFVRGDANRDWLVNMSDVVSILSSLFAGRPAAEDGEARVQTVFPCPDAADLDDDGSIQLNDAMYLALYLFQGGPAPLSPYPQPGRDSLVPEADPIDCGD